MAWQVRLLYVHKKLSLLQEGGEGEGKKKHEFISYPCDAKTKRNLKGRVAYVFQGGYRLK